MFQVESVARKTIKQLWKIVDYFISTRSGLLENALIQMENFLLGSWRGRVQDGRRGLSPLDSLGNDGDKDISCVWLDNSPAPHPSQDEPRFELASDMVMVSFLVDEEIRHPFVDHQLGRHEGLPVVMKTRPAEQALAVEAV